MFNKIHQAILTLTVVLIVIVAATIPATAQSVYYNLRMNNITGYEIDQIYLSGVNDNDWHRDLLGAFRVFQDDTSFTITQISPGHYDIKLVDEDGDVCVIRNVAVYQNLNWELSHRWLLNCERIS